jgi:hypothetical protein
MKTWQGTYIFGYGLHSIEAVDPIAEGQDKVGFFFSGSGFKSSKF